MGIVVAVAMLFGLIVLRPTPWRADDVISVDLRIVVFTSVLLSITGAWNFAWYGLRHLDDFWGIAALVSGGAMILSAVIIFLERGDPTGVGMTWVKAIRPAVIWTLAGCFILYAVTLIQLNLGYPIIR